MSVIPEEHERYRNEFEELYFQTITECGKLIRKTQNKNISIVSGQNGDIYTDDEEISIIQNMAETY